ncbi:MAG: hypothetical protein WC742_15240, partial [Gallionellaceae bacterium]
MTTISYMCSTILSGKPFELGIPLLTSGNTITTNSYRRKQIGTILLLSTLVISRSWKRPAHSNELISAKGS